MISARRILLRKLEECTQFPEACCLKQAIQPQADWRQHKPERRAKRSAHQEERPHAHLCENGLQDSAPSASQGAPRDRPSHEEARPYACLHLSSACSQTKNGAKIFAASRPAVSRPARA